jgi:hypothetical protein
MTQGDTGDRFYILTKGKAAVKKTIDGSTITLVQVQLAEVPTQSFYY